MKKIVIPAILGAVLIIAFAFAAMPVQQAQTVHTSIGNEITGLGNALCKAVLNNVNEVYNSAIQRCQVPEA